MRNVRREVLALLGISLFPTAALAQGTEKPTTMFAHDKVVSISGVVKEVHWTNPHVAIYVEGVAKGEKPATWVLEMTIPGNLTRAGVWTRNSFKPGDKVDIDMAPLRDGGKGGALKKSLIPKAACHSTPICASRRAWWRSHRQVPKKLLRELFLFVPQTLDCAPQQNMRKANIPY